MELSSTALFPLLGDKTTLEMSYFYPVSLFPHSPLLCCSHCKGSLMLFHSLLFPTGAVHMGGNNQYPLPGCAAIPHQEPRAGNGCVPVLSAGEPSAAALLSPVPPPWQSLLWDLCSQLRLAGNRPRLKALDKYSNNWNCVLQFCSLNSSSKSRMQAVLILVCRYFQLSSGELGTVRVPQERYQNKCIFNVTHFPESKIILWFCFLTGKSPQDC